MTFAHRMAASILGSALLAASLLLVSLAAAASDLPTKFDPSRDALKDVATAVAQAKSDGKRVLVDVGGEWCSWCHVLDKFMDSDDAVRSARDAAFVLVKVNWSPENKNANLLSKWPKIKGYPHFFVLDATGKLIWSQDTGELEAGESYDRTKFLVFLSKLAPT